MNKPLADNVANGETDELAGLHDIAASLLISQDSEDQQSPTGGDQNDDTGPNDDLEDDQILEDDEEESDALLGDADDDDDKSDQQDEDRGDSDEELFLDVTDDDLVAVMVDGEEKEISIGDLKKSYSAEGAYEKRVQEATETKKAAHAERTQMLTSLRAQEQVLTHALSNLDDTVFQPVVQPPDETTKTSNPQGYIRHLEAYNNDQTRIANARNAVQSKIEEVQKQHRERLAAYADDAVKEIARRIPEVADEKTGSAYVQKLAATAMAYGYSQAEVQGALDPRMYDLVNDAMKYRELVSKSSGKDVTDLSNKGAKRVRRLRSGSSGAKSRARQSDKQRKQVEAKARQTGKVADVASTLITKG